MDKSCEVHNIFTIKEFIQMRDTMGSAPGFEAVSPVKPSANSYYRGGDPVFTLYKFSVNRVNGDNKV